MTRKVVPEYDPELERRFIEVCRTILGRKNLVGGLDHEMRLFLRHGEAEVLTQVLEHYVAIRDAYFSGAEP